MLLEIAGLSKSFGGVHAISDLSFSVEEASITGLIGPNGAGKSTLIETVTGFLKPDRGVIRFGNREIQGLNPHRISAFGLMRTFQLAHEFPALTVMENMLVAAITDGRDSLWKAVLMPSALRKAQNLDRVRAREVLDTFGLLQLRDDLARTLSGGQKRLLEFARLVMAKPKMVMLDEPMAGINPTMRARIQDSVRSLSAHGITVLLVEHNLDSVEALCSTVVVMAAGQRIASGTMETLRTNRAVVDAYLGPGVVARAADG
ncbi:MAG: ABC transporter ATP-binding protein [Candidatus Dormibacteria bacterium]